MQFFLIHNVLTNYPIFSHGLVRSTLQKVDNTRPWNSDDYVPASYLSSRSFPRRYSTGPERLSNLHKDHVTLPAVGQEVDCTGRVGPRSVAVGQSDQSRATVSSKVLAEFARERQMVVHTICRFIAYKMSELWLLYVYVVSLLFRYFNYRDILLLYCNFYAFIKSIMQIVSNIKCNIFIKTHICK